MRIIILKTNTNGYICKILDSDEAKTTNFVGTVELNYRFNLNTLLTMHEENWIMITLAMMNSDLNSDIWEKIWKNLDIIEVLNDLIISDNKTIEANINNFIFIINSLRYACRTMVKSLNTKTLIENDDTDFGDINEDELFVVDSDKIDELIENHNEEILKEHGLKTERELRKQGCEHCERTFGDLISTNTKNEINESWK